MPLAFEPPCNEQDFERLCRLLFAEHWGIPDAKLYGRRGDTQHGVDLFGIDESGRVEAAQCKLHESGKKLPKSEVQSEIDKAKSFKPKLDHYAIATTAKRDPALQSWVAQVDLEHHNAGLFRVEIVSWDDIVVLLHQYPAVAEAFYGGLSAQTAGRIDGKLDQTLETLAHGSRRVEDILRVGSATRPDASNPATLLNARYEVVPFFEPSRRDELEMLRKWCDGGAATSARLFVGPGGAGKTRLFIEWAKRLKHEGWFAGFLPDKIHADDVSMLMSAAKPTLVVVDYAESRPALEEFLHAAAERPAGHQTKLRIALVGRDDGDWWRGLQSDDAHVADVLTGQEVTRLAPTPAEGELRAQIFAHACKAFAETLKKDAPRDAPRLDREPFGRMLYLHMAALAAVQGCPLGEEKLLEGIVAHETHFWLKRYAEQYEKDNQARADFGERASRVVAAVTLLGGVATKQAADELVERVAGPREEHFVRFLRALYPGRGGRTEARHLAGLEPDLLGETLVQNVLMDPGTPDDYLDRVFEGADGDALRNGFIVLGRVSLRRPDQGRAWLDRVLRVDVPGRAGHAFDAAMALGKESAAAPLGPVLAQALEDQGPEDEGTLGLAVAFDRELVKWTPAPVSLCEVAVWASERRLRELPESSDDEKVRQERAQLLNNLGSDLGDAGRREDALAATQEAVDIRRKLAAERPDAFLPGLAMSLNNPNLAASLNNLGKMLSELGRREDALAATEEAADLYRKLAAERPDAFLPDLAMSLNNLGSDLSGAGRRDDALAATQKAADVYRKLAAERPDAFLPYLAGSLNNLGKMLSDLGRPEDALAAAQEAAGIYRQLAAERPDAFLPNLATSLNNLGKMLSDLGRPEDALAATQEAVEIRRKLAADRPDAFLPDLAGSLNNLGSDLRDAGRPEDALAATEEAVDTCRKLAAERPDAFLPGLAMSLNNLGNRLSDLGRREDALAAAREAAALYTNLVERFPAAFERDLGVALRNLRRLLEENGLPVESDEAVRNAAHALKRAAAGPPAKTQGREGPEPEAKP